MEDQQHAPMPACSLMGGWRWWVVGLYHEETAYLKPIVTVKVKVIITPNPGTYMLLAFISQTPQFQQRIS